MHIPWQIELTTGVRVEIGYLHAIQRVSRGLALVTASPAVVAGEQVARQFCKLDRDHFFRRLARHRAQHFYVRFSAWWRLGDRQLQTGWVAHLFAIEIQHDVAILYPGFFSSAIRSHAANQHSAAL